MRPKSASDGGSSRRSDEGEAGEAIEWEMRPGGMLVQKRGADPEASAASLASVALPLPPPPVVKVRVSFGAARHKVAVSSQATFGELKKLLAAATGLKPAEQRLVYKGKERESGEYLDSCGVKNRSKIVLEEDPASRERRLAEMQRNARVERVNRAISDASLEIDKLADQVTAIEKSISNGSKVADLQISTLIELFMMQAIRVDSIPAEGDDVTFQKNLQAKRIQKCVETLDVLKISNARVNSVVVTTKWETFESQTPTRPWEFFD